MSTLWTNLPSFLFECWRIHSICCVFLVMEFNPLSFVKMYFNNIWLCRYIEKLVLQNQSLCKCSVMTNMKSLSSCNYNKDGAFELFKVCMCVNFIDISLLFISLFFLEPLLFEFGTTWPCYIYIFIFYL